MHLHWYAEKVPQGYFIVGNALALHTPKKRWLFFFVYDIIIFKESTMTIRFIGGLWRRIDGKNIKSFSTYQEAVDNKTCW